VIERFGTDHQAAELAAMTQRLRRAGVARVAIERGDGPVKDDRFDAFVLADVLRSDGHRLVSLTPDGPATIGLRALVRARKDLVKHRIALGDQLRADLLAAFPARLGCLPRSATAAPAFLTTPRWLLRPESRPAPAPAASATTSPSGTPATRSCAKH
jgi:hypothetical protein